MVKDVKRCLVDDFLSRKITRNISNLRIKKEETIMRKSKMTIIILGCIGIFLIAALVLLPATQAKAETMKYHCTSQITKYEHVLFPDVEGHVVGVFERRGVDIFENEVAAFEARGTFDQIKNVKTTFQGYGQITFKDGSTIIQEHQGTFVPSPGEKFELYKDCKGKYIKGTGRFKGIKGEFSFTGRRITPYTKDKTKGDNWIEATGTYTLPKK